MVEPLVSTTSRRKFMGTRKENLCFDSAGQKVEVRHWLYVHIMLNSKRSAEF